MSQSLRQLVGVLCFSVVICSSGAARAEPIGLNLLDSPDIFAGFLDVTYNASNGVFSSIGYSLTFDDGGLGGPLNIMGGTFDITATIDNTGSLGTGTIEIGGSVAGSGPTLLTGELTTFGFRTSGGDPFEFLFEITGGALAEFYGGVGAEAGIILTALSNFSGSFASDFDNLTDGMPGTGQGLADVAPVPAPSAAILGAIGIVMIGVVRRR